MLPASLADLPRPHLRTSDGSAPRSPLQRVLYGRPV